MTRSPKTPESDETQVTVRAEVLAAMTQAKGKNVAHPSLVVVAGLANVGRMYGVDGTLVIGRSATAGVLIEEDGVSREHARVEPLPDGSVQVTDLESRNGTFVNGTQVTTAQILHDGDKIQIGATTMLKLSYLDASEEAFQRNLYQSATRDPLTQLANRRAFGEALDREIAFAKRHGRPLCLVAFDVDHFKRVNDTFGHPAGDYVLRRLGEVVGACVRAEDLVARVGGEEFTVLVRDIPLGGAKDCAERLRRNVEATIFEHSGRRIPVTISLGVAVLDPADPTAKGLVQAADAWLYAAKRGGRNRVAAT